MHYVRRVVLVLLLLMLALTAVPATFMALNIPVDLRVLKRPLINAASSQLGLDVTIDGDMRLVPGLAPTMAMGGLRSGSSTSAWVRAISRVTCFSTSPANVPAPK